MQNPSFFACGAIQCMFEGISALYRVLKPKKIACGATQCIFESISALYGAIKLHFFRLRRYTVQVWRESPPQARKKIAFLDL